MTRSLVLLAAILVSACAPAAAPSDTSPGATAATTGASAAPEPAVSIAFWHGQSGVLGDRLNELIAKFNSSHKIQVQGTFQGNYDQLYQKVVSAIQAGSVPDLAMVNGPPQMAQYWKAKALAPVQQFVDSPDGFTKDQLNDFVGALLDDNSLLVNGKKTLVSWPLSKSLALLYYDPDILKAAGVSVPKTWDEFRTALKTVKAKTDATPLAYSADVFYVFLPYLWSQGGEVLSEDLSKPTFNSPEGVAALQYMADLALTDKTAQVGAPGTFDWQNPFAQGKVAFAISTSVSRPFIEQAMPKDKTFKVGMAPLPSGSKAAKTDLFGNNLVIFANRPPDDQRAAWLFMKWLTEVDQTVWWSLQSGYMPLRTSALNAPDWKAAAEKDDRVLVAVNALKTGHGIPGSPDWPKMQPALNDMVVSVVLGKAAPKDALATAEKKVNDILAGY